MSWRDTTLTILSGATESAELNLAADGTRWGKDLVFFSPGTLPETVKVHLARVVGGTYAILEVGGSDVALVANKAQLLTGLAAGALKLVATGAVAANRVFTIQGVAKK